VSCELPHQLIYIVGVEEGGYSLKSQGIWRRLPVAKAVLMVLVRTRSTSSSSQWLPLNPLPPEFLKFCMQFSKFWLHSVLRNWSAYNKTITITLNYTYKINHYEDCVYKNKYMEQLVKLTTYFKFIKKGDLIF
jgi:hypothetical protein